MPRWPRRILFVLAVLSIVLLYSAFESYVVKSGFMVSLYGVITTLLGETWRLVSNPIVFIAILIFVFLWAFRNRIDSMFPAIRELTAAGVSLKFDQPENKVDEGGSLSTALPSSVGIMKDGKKPEPATVSAESEAALQAGSIALLSEPMGRVLLGVDDKVIPVDDFIRKLDEEKVFEKNVGNVVDDAKRRMFYGGAFRALWLFYCPHLLTYETSEDRKTAHVKLKLGVREKIEKRLSQLQTQNLQQDSIP